MNVAALGCGERARVRRQNAYATLCPNFRQRSMNELEYRNSLIANLGNFSPIAPKPTKCIVHFEGQTPFFLLGRKCGAGILTKALIPEL